MFAPHTADKMLHCEYDGTQSTRPDGMVIDAGEASRYGLMLHF